MTLQPVAPRTGIEPVSSHRQWDCDASRITRQCCRIEVSPAGLEPASNDFRNCCLATRPRGRSIKRRTPPAKSHAPAGPKAPPPKPQSGGAVGPYSTKCRTPGLPPASTLVRSTRHRRRRVSRSPPLLACGACGSPARSGCRTGIAPASTGSQPVLVTRRVTTPYE